MNLVASGIGSLPLCAKIAIAAILAVGAAAIGGWGVIRAWYSVDDRRGLLVLVAHASAAIGLGVAYLGWCSWALGG
ncbi:hypothetical protein EAH84_02255 [Sphingomonas oligophenolica]|uniref:Uncharacterized protein n=1 Tax=Sphingomonas oligophenolica TaxID=301154 RepID=A0A502CSC7_9SPHN|nr:hypothetical protein EAH84_02255 [Sphingomonas oligophenolica]